MSTRRALLASLATGALVTAVAVISIASGSAQAATVATLQAETMTSVQGYGATVISDSTASGGKALLIDSNVTVKKAVSLPSASSSFTVRAHTDGTAASMTVTVDGVAFSATSVSAQTWTNYTFTRSLAAGSHTVKIAFTNACCRNLYLDVLTFDSTVSPSPTTTSPSPSPTATATAISAYLTGYSYWDNDPPGSADICCPQVHQQAGGTGTYADPITLAVGINNGVLDWPAGTKFYVPALERYFVVEDSCAACHSGTRPAGTTTWVDAWVGGSDTTATVADNCMNKITGVHNIYKNPPSNYAVVSGPIVSSAGCTSLYGETPVTV